MGSEDAFISESLSCCLTVPWFGVVYRNPDTTLSAILRSVCETWSKTVCLPQTTHRVYMITIGFWGDCSKNGGGVAYFAENKFHAHVQSFVSVSKLLQFFYPQTQTQTRTML